MLPPLQKAAAQDAAPGIHAQKVYQLFGGAEKVRHEILSAGMGGAEDSAFAGAREKVSPRKRIDQEQQRRGAVADAGDGLELLERCVQNGGNGAEVLQELPGQGIGVTPGQGIKEQQLQHLVVLQRVQAVVQESLLEPLPMAVVFSHGGFSLLRRTLQAEQPLKIAE